jgi:endonuclease III
MFLNQTSRKQVEQVWRPFVALVPDASTLLSVPQDVVKDVIAPLGFKNRRTAALYRMSEVFVGGSWKCVSELPGVGPYAHHAYRIFITGDLGEAAPNDHKLVEYWHWAKRQA